jgi:hypothetical protein
LDDLTGTVFAGHHQPGRGWSLGLYFMGLNLSHRQIAEELGLNPGDVQQITEPLRTGVVAAQPEPSLSGEVECEEVYVVAGHKGQPEAVKKRPSGASAAAPRCARTRHLGGRKSPRSSGCSNGAVRWSSAC